MHHYLLLVLTSFSLSACMLYTNNIKSTVQYNNLIMRDMAFIIDDSETISSIFLKNNFFTTYFLPTVITDDLRFVLNNQLMPIITTSYLLTTLNTLTEIFEILTEELSFNDLKTKFAGDSYKYTILQEDDTLRAFSLACKLVKTSTLKYLKNISNNNQNMLINNLAQHSNFNSSIISLNQKTTLIRKALELYKHYLIMKEITLNQYIAKKLDDFLLLIIPQNYLELKLKQWRTELFSLLNTNLTIPYFGSLDKTKFSAKEVALGIKYEKLPIINNLFNLKAPTIKKNAFTFLNHTKNSLIDTLNKLFITSNYKILKDLFKWKITNKDIQNILPSYTWNFYISGHGSLSNNSLSVTSGMFDETFKRLLLFFNSKITTNFIFYSSCFGAGAKLKLFTIPHQNFTLVAGAIAEIPTTILTPPFFTLSKDNKTLIPYYYADISSAFKELRKNTPDYFTLLNKINLFWKKKLSGNTKFYIQNIPHVKFPNNEWFSIANLNKKELILNKRLRDIYEHTQKTLLINNKELLFLYPNYIYEDQEALERIFIPFPVKIKGKMPTVFSMATNLSKETRYVFQEINAADFTLSELALQFMSFPSKYNTSIVIKRLIIKNTLFIENASGYEKSNKALLSLLSPRPTISTITLHNVEIDNLKQIVKDAENGQATAFVLYFQFKNKGYLIQTDYYQDFKDLMKSKDGKNVNDFVQQEPAFINDDIIPKPQKRFEDLETMLQNKIKTEDLLRYKNALQALSSTLTSLALS